MGVVLLGGVCAGTGGAEGEVASYGGGGCKTIRQKKAYINQFDHEVKMMVNILNIFN